MPLQDNSVGRYRITGAQQYAITRLQRIGGHAAALAVIVVTQRGLRQRLHQSLDRGRAALARHALEVAACRQEENEHHHRVEVNLAVPPGGRQAAAGKGDQDGDADRQVHAHAPLAQVAPGRTYKRYGRVTDDRQRQHQAKPAKQLLKTGFHAGPGPRVEADRQHHHLHAEQARHRDTAQLGAPLALILLLL